MPPGAAVRDTPRPGERRQTAPAFRLEPKCEMLDDVAERRFMDVPDGGHVIAFARADDATAAGNVRRAVVEVGEHVSVYAAFVA